MIEGIRNFWKKHLNSFRYGLAILFVVTTIAATILIVTQMGLELAVILQLISATELSWAAASHIYLNFEPKSWKKHLALLMEIGALLNPLNPSISLDELVREKRILCAGAILLPDMGEMTDAVIELSSSINNWNPTTLSDSSRSIFYDDITLLVQKIRKSHGLEVRYSVGEVYVNLVRSFLSDNRIPVENIFHQLKEARGLPSETLTQLDKSVIYNPDFILSLAKSIPPDDILIRDIIKIMNHNDAKPVLNECILIILEIIQNNDFIDLVDSLLIAIENSVVLDDTRISFFQKSIDLGYTDFSKIGTKGIQIADSLSEEQRKKIYYGAIPSANSDIQSFILSRLEHGDRKGAELIASNIMKWKPNEADNAMIFLQKARYPNLIDLLFQIARDHKETATRRDALKHIGEWGEYKLITRLNKCLNQEGDSGIRTYIELVIRTLEDKIPKPRGVKSVFDRDRKSQFW